MIQGSVFCPQSQSRKKYDFYKILSYSLKTNTSKHVLTDFHERIWVPQGSRVSKGLKNTYWQNKFKEHITYSDKPYFIIQNNPVD